MTEPPAARWTDEECFRLNAAQHDHRFHGYTCGSDSRHRPLVATPDGWRCPDCHYRQYWAHGVPRLRPAAGDDAVGQALDVIRRYGLIAGDHHKQWVLDQVVRALTGAGYADWVASFDDPDYDTWAAGIPP